MQTLEETLKNVLDEIASKYANTCPMELYLDLEKFKAHIRWACLEYAEEVARRRNEQAHPQPVAAVVERKGDNQ